MSARRVAWAAVIISTIGCPHAMLRGQAAAHPVASTFSATLTSREHRYRVDARVRPLLFWISRSDIGDGRIRWFTGPDGATGYDLLVGSDPARTPRRINRWGYLREESNAAGATVFGVMSRSDEESIEDADRNTNRPGEPVHRFKAVRQHVSGSEAHITGFDLRQPTDVTYHHLDVLLASVPNAPSRTRRATVQGWDAPGFLAATAELLTEGRAAAGSAKQPARPVRAYPYNGTLYEIHLQSTERVRSFVSGNRSFGPAIRGRFQVHNRATGSDTWFSIVYGVTGELADVPLFISFRPRWWIEIQCVLDDVGTDARAEQ